MRTFETGATRDTDEGKYDYDGFLSPLVLESFASYMHDNRLQADGTVRDSDNWQKGMGLNVYIKSLWRHFFSAWKSHRTDGNIDDRIRDLNAVLFNTQGYLHELLEKQPEEKYDDGFFSTKCTFHPYRDDKDDDSEVGTV